MVRPHRTLGMVLARRGELQQAVRHLEWALQIDPHDGESRELLQQIHAAKPN